MEGADAGSTVMFWITRPSSNSRIEVAFVYSSSVITCFAFDGGVGLEGEGNGEGALANEADKRENVGLSNPLKECEAVVEEGDGGSNVSWRLSTAALAHSPLLSCIALTPQKRMSFGQQRMFSAVFSPARSWVSTLKQGTLCHQHEEDPAS